MLSDLLTIKPILKSLTTEEEEKQSAINRMAWNNISRQLNTLEMTCSCCDDFKTHDIHTLLKHEQKCEEYSNEEYLKAYGILKKKGVVEDIRSKFEIHQCERCDRVFKNKYLLQQHNSRGKNPKGCLRVHINNLIKNMDDNQLLELKELIKENMII